ncbi:MAG TPA: MBL fold metallo-hydrolase [Thermoplasmatales archaeon]|nr:MBL fold metallo-hydrolase [Thermoplasmatales archaeon]
MITKILGGGREVGRVGLFNKFDGIEFLVDYGFMPQEPPKYPIESPEIRNAFLTHAHIDHSGMMPWLCSRYNTNVFSTRLTAEIAEILYRDSLKLAYAKGRSFPYGENEVEIINDRFVYYEQNDRFLINDFEFHFHPAGHIPGSVLVEMVDSEVAFACDINTIDTNLVEGAKPVKCRTLFIEGTYAGVNHPDRDEMEKEFIDEIEDILKRGGKVIIPAFAVGRTQEIALILDRMGEEIWLDGMGYKISEIMLKYRQYIKNTDRLKKIFEEINFVYSGHGRKLALKSGLILTTSGMVNGGPVIWYIDKIKDDPKSAVIITGYQVEGTNGRMLLENREIDLYGIKTKVNCKVKYYDFSAHAGHNELLKFIKGCSPENVVLFHSENPEKLAEEIDFAEVYIPENGEEIKI